MSAATGDHWLVELTGTAMVLDLRSEQVLAQIGHRLWREMGKTQPGRLTLRSRHMARPKRPTLTDCQRRVLDAIEQYVDAHGYAPSLREIGHRSGLRSPSSVQHHVRALEEHGCIRRRHGCPRTIELLTSNHR